MFCAHGTPFVGKAKWSKSPRGTWPQRQCQEGCKLKDGPDALEVVVRQQDQPRSAAFWTQPTTPRFYVHSNPSCRSPDFVCFWFASKSERMMCFALTLFNLPLRGDFHSGKIMGRVCLDGPEDSHEPGQHGHCVGEAIFNPSAAFISMKIP